MKELNELVELASKADKLCLLMRNVNPHTILAIAEAFRALEQELEKECDILIDTAESMRQWRQRAEAAESALNMVRAQRDLEMTRNDEHETEKAKLHAEIYRLQEEVRGPDGFDTWKDAAIALKLAAKNKVNDIDYLTAMSAFHSKDWHGVDPITGYMKGWNARPAPAVSLAELVPEKRITDFDCAYYPLFKARDEGWNECIDHILRNIEEAKK